MIRREELECDLTSELGILGEVDFTDGAAAEETHDAVAAEDVTGGEGRRRLFRAARVRVSRWWDELGLFVGTVLLLSHGCGLYRR